MNEDVSIIVLTCQYQGMLVLVILSGLLLRCQNKSIPMKHNTSDNLSVL